jgi:hypothetical protein
LGCAGTYKRTDPYYKNGAFDVAEFMRLNFDVQLARLVGLVQTHRGFLEYYLQLLPEGPRVSQLLPGLFGVPVAAKPAPVSIFAIMPLRAGSAIADLLAKAGVILQLMSGLRPIGPRAEVEGPITAALAKFHPLAADFEAGLADIRLQVPDDPAPDPPGALMAIPLLGSRWGFDGDAILGYLARNGSYAALIVTSALRQNNYPIASRASGANTEILVANAIAEAAGLSLIIDGGTFRSAAHFSSPVVPAALFQTFTTAHLANGVFDPKGAACAIVNAIVQARQGPGAAILGLGGIQVTPAPGAPPAPPLLPTVPLAVAPQLLAGPRPLLNIFLYGSFDAAKGESLATAQSLAAARAISESQQIRVRGGDGDQYAGGRDLMVSSPSDTFGQLLAPINDTLTIALTSIESYMRNGMDFLTDFRVPVLNIQLPAPPKAIAVPNIEPYIHQLMTALSAGVTDAADDILRQCGTILADYRGVLKSGIAQEITAGLGKAITSALEIYFGILNEAVGIWSSTVAGILKGLVIKIEPQVRPMSAITTAPRSLPAVRVRAQLPIPAPARAGTELATAVGDVSAGLHVAAFAILIGIFLMALSKVI